MGIYVHVPALTNLAYCTAIVCLYSICLNHLTICMYAITPIRLEVSCTGKCLPT